MDARTFGYFAARWAAEGALQSRETFTRAPLSKIDGLSFAAKAPYHAVLILTALHGAAYWVFACHLPNIKFGLSTEEIAEVLSGLKTGRDDAMKEFKQPSGESIAEHELKFLTSQFDRFYNALVDDTTDLLTKSRDTLNLAPSTACLHFLKILKNNYGVELNHLEQLILSQFVDETAAATLHLIGERIVTHTS
jgi:hypothetical protein